MSDVLDQETPDANGNPWGAVRATAARELVAGRARIAALRSQAAGIGYGSGRQQPGGAQLGSRSWESVVVDALENLDAAELALLEAQQGVLGSAGALDKQAACELGRPLTALAKALLAAVRAYVKGAEHWAAAELCRANAAGYTAEPSAARRRAVELQFASEFDRLELESLAIIRHIDALARRGAEIGEAADPQD